MQQQAMTEAAPANRAPIPMECEAPFLKVVGELPRELNGTLYRNGPNRTASTAIGLARREKVMAGVNLNLPSFRGIAKR